MPDAQPTTVPSSRRFLAGAAVALLYLFLLTPILLDHLPNGRAAFDEINYHEPTIRVFARELPLPWLRDYLSATTPGYHLLLAAVSLALPDSEWLLRAANIAISLALVGLLAGTCAARARSWRAALLALPFAASMHVLFSGAWLLPDNLGWLFVLAVLLVCLRIPFRPIFCVHAGALLLLLVLARQIHLWAAAPIIAAAWMSVLFPDPHHHPGLPRPAAPGGIDSANWRELLFARPIVRTHRAFVAAVCCAPAAIAVISFYRIWNGLVPPSFQGQYHNPNPAAPAFILALFGLFSLFFIPILLPGLARAWRERRWILFAAVAAALLAALLPATTHSVEGGRHSGLWNISRALESRGFVLFGRTSPLIAGLAALGGAALVAWLRLVPFRTAIVLLAALAGFTAAQAASYQLFQRYTEPFLLLLLALLGAFALQTTAPRSLRACLALPALLGALLAFQTALSLRGAQPAGFFGFHAGDPRLKAYLVDGDNAVVDGKKVEPLPRGARP